MICTKCGAGDPNKTQMGHVSIASGFACQNCGQHLMPEPEPKQVITERMMRDALKADEQSRTLLNRANTALTAERAAHQDTRAQLDEANKKLLEAEVTFKNLQSRLEAAQASASTAPNVVQHSTLGAGFPK